MTEPLTVEELERLAREIVSMISPFVSTSEAFEERCIWVKGRLQSHSRQLWLEAAEIAEELLGHMSCTCLRSVKRVFRAKAESTPKPSPALPEKP